MIIENVNVDNSYVRMRIKNVTVDKSYVIMRIGNATDGKSYVIMRIRSVTVDTSYIQMRIKNATVNKSYVRMRIGSAAPIINIDVTQTFNFQVLCLDGTWCRYLVTSRECLFNGAYFVRRAVSISMFYFRMCLSLMASRLDH